MYFTDRGIEELEDRRGDEEVTMAWLAERLRDFVDLNPEFEVPVDRLASWLARLDDDQDLLYGTGRGACLPGACGAWHPSLVLRGLRRTAVTGDARPTPVHSVWMPRSCRQVCMAAASTSYGPSAGVVPGACVAAGGWPGMAECWRGAPGAGWGGVRAGGGGVRAGGGSADGGGADGGGADGAVCGGRLLVRDMS
jgi:Family of unknown function (DUF6104)